MTTSAAEIKTIDPTPALLRQLPADAAESPAAGNGMKVDPERIFHAARDSAEFFDHLQAHYRDTRRTLVEIECDVTLLLADGALFDTGAGVLLNVSSSGALIGRLKLEKGCLPAQPFKLFLVLKREEYKGVRIEATPVRFADEVFGLGVKFAEISVSA
jgi:hypothetical protein